MLAGARAVIQTLARTIPMKSPNTSSTTPKPLGTAAVLLAAGSASRMGGQPKCLLQLDGISLIERQIMALQAVGITHIVVVLGHYAAAISAAVQQV